MARIEWLENGNDRPDFEIAGNKNTQMDDGKEKKEQPTEQKPKTEKHRRV